VLRIVLRIQAAIYVSTGVWPLINLASFEQVTGPKTDDWLVYTVGLLLAAIGVTLWLGARSERPNSAFVFLAAATAASLAVIDLTYALSGRISSIYLLDAAGEIVLLAAIIAGALRLRSGR
jgi:energy-converting hydrogenase Eha subunit E